MIGLIEGAARQKTPNEIALDILLVGLTIIFVFATVTIPSYVAYAGGAVSVIILVALFVTLIPTTIGALLSAIGIAGMDRLVRFNVLAMSGRAVEASGDVDTLLLDAPNRTLIIRDWTRLGFGVYGLEHLDEVRPSYFIFDCMVDSEAVAATTQRIFHGRRSAVPFSARNIRGVNRNDGAEDQPLEFTLVRLVDGQ